jgi:D-glycero-D-manno-heptose 1,7-bisphosphate phosphatase
MTKADTKTDRAVFLDRDGTIIDELGYLGDPGGVNLFPEAAGAMRRLLESGYRLVVVTNQSGIGRGYFSEEDAVAVNLRLLELLEKGSVKVDCVYYCPHLPDEGCSCRKPGARMLEKAATDLDIDLAASWMVGDTGRDVEAGTAAGCRAVLLDCGKDEKGLVPPGSFRAADLAAAARLILETEA